jgi:hypothetical protein
MGFRHLSTTRQTALNIQKLLKFHASGIFIVPDHCSTQVTILLLDSCNSDYFLVCMHLQHGGEGLLPQTLRRIFLISHAFILLTLIAFHLCTQTMFL